MLKKELYQYINDGQICSTIVRLASCCGGLKLAKILTFSEWKLKIKKLCRPINLELRIHRKLLWWAYMMIRLCMSKSPSCPRAERDFSPEGISRDRNSFLSSTGSGSKQQHWNPSTASPTTGTYVCIWTGKTWGELLHSAAMSRPEVGEYFYPLNPT